MSRNWARLTGIYGIRLMITLATGAMSFEAKTGESSRLAASVTSLNIAIWGAAAIMIVAVAIIARVLANRKYGVTSPKAGVNNAAQQHTV